MDEIFKCPLCGDVEGGMYTVERIRRHDLYEFSGYPTLQYEDESHMQLNKDGLTPAYCRKCHQMLGYVDPNDSQSSYVPTNRVKMKIREEMRIKK